MFSMLLRNPTSVLKHDKFNIFFISCLIIYSVSVIRFNNWKTLYLVYPFPDPGFAIYATSFYLDKQLISGRIHGRIYGLPARKFD